MSFTLGKTPQNMPCTQDCTAETGRTVTCKFDGTCHRWIAYQLTLPKKPFAQDYMSIKDKRSLMKISGGRI